MATEWEAYLMHRVDAARRLMTVPGKGAEASGRLFLAKRCHEAAKAGRDVPGDLDALLAQVLEGLSPAAHDGARREAEAIRAEAVGAGPGGP